MSTKVSIIIPAYNTEEYMAECLDSILNQTLQDIEIIVVDDGSSDNTWNILQEYQEKYPNKVRVFHKENGGQASARNLALEYATGEFLGFVDSDDWIDHETYEEMYNKAISEGADIVVCDMVDHYPNYEIYHHASVFDDKFRVTPSACNKIFKRNFAGEVRFPVGLWYEDFEYTTKQLMKTEKISVIHKGFYHCHCREVSTMNNNNALKNKDILTVIENLQKFVDENQWKERYADVMEYLYLEHIMITTINRLEVQQNKEKKGVIRFLRAEVLKKYPKFYRDSVFKGLPRNRRIIARLNAAGMSKLSKWMLSLKAKL